MAHHQAANHLIIVHGVEETGMVYAEAEIFLYLDRHRQLPAVRG